jgi:antitoxin component YwqK of YwqJK toxin-antitoxin module
MSDITPELLEQIHLANKKRKEAQALSLNDEPSIPIPQESSVSSPPDSVYESKDEAGNVVQQTPYKNNLIEGMMKTYDDLGSLLCEIPFVKGKKEGIGIIYMNDTKASEISFQNDHMDGPYIAYHPNGAISTQVTYKENHMDGELSAFDDNGKLLKKETYTMGKKSGPSQTFYPSGKLYEEATFENNIPIHQSTAYHENGKPMVIKHYKDGKTLSVDIYDENGKLQEKKPDA